MADSEQIYQEVLQEEQQKGSAGPVAEGRAKAARSRAEHGSPHPKEPRWWPGAQPHLEGGDGAAPVDEVAEPEPAEPEPAEPEVAQQPAPEPEPAEAPAAEAAPTPEPAPAPAPQAAPEPAPAPAAQPAAAAVAAPAQAPAAVQAAQPVAQAPATVAPPEPAEPARPSGVTHGTASGNRLRPEDGVSTEAQFEGQRAVYERRKLIDELVATGVPAVTAAGTGRPRAPYLAVLYLIIPLVVIVFLVGQASPSAETEPAGGTTEEPAPGGGGGGGGGGDVTLVASNLAFDTDAITLPADQDAIVTLDNEDTVVHDFSLYETEEDADAQASALFDGADVDGGDSIDYDFTTPAAGDYVFQCDIHPTMRGDATVQ